MSFLLNWVWFCQDELSVRSLSVIRFAVGNGIEVNSDTTSKDIMVLSGSILRSFMCSGNVVDLLME